MAVSERTMKGGKEDLRQRRSKRHLSEALVSLMEERPLRDISVVDICERAMVHRTTFYAHFEDKNALLQHVLEELIDGLAQSREKMAREHGLRAGLLAEFQVALEFFKEHKRFYLASRSGGGREMDMIGNAMAEAIEKLIAEEGSLGFLNGEPYEAATAARFYSGALMSLVRWWLESETPITEEQMARTVDKLLPEAPAGA